MKSLSKSQYVRGNQCLKSLWLYRNRKDLQDPVDPFQQSIFHSGTAFGLLAMKRFAGGVLIHADHAHPEDALAQTADAVASGTKIIYEAAFLFEDVLVRADVVTKNDNGTWDLTEVKSATKMNDVYLLDVAVQRHVMSGAGFPVAHARVAHANPGYVRYGELDLDKLFVVVDVTEASEPALSEVPQRLGRMKVFADAPAAPEIGIGSHCANPYPCDFEGNCWAHVPEYSVFNLAYAKMETKLDLFNRGVQLVHQVNPDFDNLTDKRTIKQVQIARLGKPYVDLEAIGSFLNGLRYPIAHLDFETDNPVIPPYDGLKPYQQMPFQASVRVQQERGGPLTEYGYLGDGLEDPRRDLIGFLSEHVPEQGHVLAYYKSFEGGRLKELAQGPGVGNRGPQLLDMAARLVDLADPFSKNWYTHPGFKGKWSIKNVLPILVPTMTYAGLVIRDGTAAMAAYAELRDPKLDPARRAMLTEALKVYCGQDTMAMVKILEHLWAQVGVAA
ncbi:MAG: DUF2779 domain-containing protein [Sphingomonadales bacterium]|nr:DUF2779 domain-containing protein [Sphingomonadaceae bacterium]MBS3930376.1 DUF2779 domain-containing protein [Sphingomonadales bacterium]